VKPKFKIQFLEDASEFLDNLDEKDRDKIIYNIYKSQITDDKELFKNWLVKSGNLERYLIKPNIDYLLFGIRPKKQKRL